MTGPSLTAAWCRPVAPTPGPPLGHACRPLPVRLPGRRRQHDRQRALPTLNRHLGASITSLQWIVDAYAWPSPACCSPAGGSVTVWDARARCRWAWCSLDCSRRPRRASHSTGTLISARALMGVAAAFIFPASLAILTERLPRPAERQKALGIWGATSGMAVAFGPIIGGALLEHFWYGSIFLVNVPIVGVTPSPAACSSPSSPEVANTPSTSEACSSRRWGDQFGAGHHRGPQWGWASVGTLACFAAAAVLLAAFSTARAAHGGPAARRAGLRRRPRSAVAPSPYRWPSSASSGSSS